MPRLRALLPNALLLLGSLALTLGAAELAVRLLVDPSQQQPLTVTDVDPASRRLSFLPNHAQHHQTSEFSFGATYNRFGRRDREWPPEVVADPASVILVGDSFVYGVGVDEPGTIASLLEARAAREGAPREVMNFGMPGGGPPGYALLVEQALAAGFGAGTVVAAVFTGNDFYPNVLTYHDEAVSAPPAAPAGRGRPHSRLVDFLRLRISQSARMVGFALTVGRWLGISLYDGAGTYVYLRQRTPEQEALFQDILSHIGRMKRACDAAGRHLLVVVFPNRIQVENGDELTNAVFDAERPGRDVLAYCREQGIPCLDLLPEMARLHRETGEALFYPIDRHFNERGYRAAAEAIYAFLREQGALVQPAAKRRESP